MFRQTPALNHAPAEKYKAPPYPHWKNYRMNTLNFILDKLKFGQSGRTYGAKKLRHNGASVFDYDFIMNLDEKDYPYYLCQAYFIKTGEKLNLKHPKTLNEKIQWLKIYDNKPVKTELTDKILVRRFVKDKIGGEYLKPVLQISRSFDEINFDALPDCFVIKCNHGCKWHFTIKNKIEFLNNKSLYALSEKYMSNWLKQTFFGWSDFETQYKNIPPEILIEPFLSENINEQPLEIEVWCFNGKAKIIQKYKNHKDDKNRHRIVSSFDENFNRYDVKFLQTNEIIPSNPDEQLILAKKLSEILADNFKFVRVDWIINNNKLYFSEMTFTPYSGYIFFPENNDKFQREIGNMLNLKGD